MRDLVLRLLLHRSWLTQVAVLLLAEFGLFQSYRHHDAGFHWAAHFLVGLTAAALLGLAWLGVRGSAPRAFLLWVLAAHLFAMFPDLLFRAGVAHAGWMNLFLGHIWVHYVPGGNSSWLVVALLASGVYAARLASSMRSDGGPQVRATPG